MRDARDRVARPHRSQGTEIQRRRNAVQARRAVPTARHRAAIVAQREERVHGTWLALPFPRCGLSGGARWTGRSCSARSLRSRSQRALGSRLRSPSPGPVVPAVPVVPAEYASTPESVGYYFRESQPDPRLRVLAIHDYIADRVAYDDDALARGVPRDDADAEWVFEHRKGVCAGYANLFTRIATVADLDVVTVGGRVAQGEHAWNAVWLDGAWRFVDVTWDRRPSGEVVHDYFMARDPSFHGDHVLDRERSRGPSDARSPGRVRVSRPCRPSSRELRWTWWRATSANRISTQSTERSRFTTIWRCAWRTTPPPIGA